MDPTRSKKEKPICTEAELQAEYERVLKENPQVGSATDTEARTR